MATPKPNEIEKRLRQTLGSADATRQDLLRKSMEEGRQEAKAFGRIRDRLVQALGQDDPRIRTLDRRAKGNERMSTFIESGLKEPGISGQIPKPDVGQSPEKPPRGTKKGKARENKEEPEEPPRS